MQCTKNLILAAALLFLSAKNAHSQDFDVLSRSLVEFRRACTGKRHAGQFQRSGSLRYECVLRNGDTATVLTVGKTGDAIRVLGIVYEAHGVQAWERVRVMNWLSFNEIAHDELIRWSRGTDACVFAEWHGTVTTTLLLRCPRKTTITRILHFPENARSTSARNHQN